MDKIDTIRLQDRVRSYINSTRDEFTRQTYHHEVLLSFNNDSSAEFFREWWSEEGAMAFAKRELEQEDE